jgi:hypothetical protein
MAKAVYTSENIGHYGLGFSHYCHFTSPIRRYPDILVHRVLSGILEDHILPDKKMEQKCQHTSERERAAMETERAANKYKQVEFMKQFLGEEFEAVISGVAGFGFWAETIDHKCEGLVSISTLQDYDDFIYIESDYALVGKRSGWAFRIGDSVRIKDAFVINIGVNFDITVAPNYNSNEVILAAITAVREYFNINSWQINQPILLKNLSLLIDNIDGVQTVKNVEIVNLTGQALGYSNYSYDTKGATIDNVVYPSIDPMIFEVKYPNVDIKGRVVSL